MTEGSGTAVNVVLAERNALRLTFTATLNKFQNAMQDCDGESNNIEQLYAMLSDKFDRLTGKEEQVRKGLASTSEIEKEMAATEEFRDMMTTAVWEMQKYQQKLDATGSSTEEDPKKIYRLPKLELQKYDLSPCNWLPFWAQYGPIHDDSKLTISEKFQYLLMSLKDGSKAKQMMLSFPQDHDNFLKAIEALKDRFGRDELLIEVFTRQLISLVLKNDKNVALSSLYDELNTQLRALEGLGMTADKCAFVIYPLVESCLPSELLKVYERQRSDRGGRGSSTSLASHSINPLEDLMAFLAEEVRSEERVKLASQPLGQLEVSKTPTAAVLVATEKGKPHKPNCIFCEKEHASQDCARAQTMKLLDLESLVRKKGVCFKCLRKGHRSNECKAFVRCILCGKGHYVLMCRDRHGSKEKEKDTSKGKSLACFSGQERPPTYLKTMLVDIVGENESMTVRALIDDGAHRSYVAKSVVNTLKLKAKSKEYLTLGLFGGVNGPSSMHGVYDIEVRGIEKGKKESLTLSVLDEDKICSQLSRPSLLRDPGLFSELRKRGVWLTDVGDDPPPVELLIGADALGALLTGNMHVLPNGVTAIETKLGWSVVGSSSRKAKAMISCCLSALNIPSMWDLEPLGICEPIMPQPAKKVMDDAELHFANTVTKDDEGHYVVELPWAPEHPPLGDNYEVAKARLELTTMKLKKEGFYDSYNNIFKQWLEEGIIEPASGEATMEHYLPHRPVIKLEKISTKVRPVFDASASRPGCASLNQCLFKGPNLLQEIPLLLLKFRLGKYGVTADVKQAFLQMKVSQKDRDVLRFLWWDDDGGMRMYRHCRVVFGVTCSPFLLNATIAHHLGEHLNETTDHKGTIEKLQNSFYVDDSVTSCETEDELNLFMGESAKVMLEGKFDLRRWTSNAPWVAREAETAKVLGLNWNLDQDVLSCVGVKNAFTGKITKRMLLGLVNAIYDPIGFLSPAVLIPRMLLQDTWKSKIAWDEALPPDLQKVYDSWAQHISDIEVCRIPRRVCSNEINEENTTLHVFADASQRGYGCCIYLRNESNGVVTVQLVAAKSRVAPLQAQTIPRMELLAACVAVRLIKSVEGAFKALIKRIFWTDSMTVLAWVTKALPWGTFVGNRVEEIRAGSDVSAWRHVPGILNPADLASRGCTFAKLTEVKWWEGPSWLKEPEDSWPQAEISFTQDSLSELKAGKGEEVCLLSAEMDSAQVELLSNDLTRYFSRYNKVLRMVAWILRFAHNATKEEKRSGQLEADEILVAETKILALVQAEADCTPVNVQVHKDAEGMIRVSSRVVASDRETSLIVLPSDHAVVRLLIDETAT